MTEHQGASYEPGGPVAKSTVLLSPTQEATAEAAKTLFADTLTAGRDYCKFMVPVAAGEIPTYLALAKFVGIAAISGPNPSTLYVLAVIPAVLFVLSALAFVWGVLPKVFGSWDVVSVKQSGTPSQNDKKGQPTETIDTPEGTDSLYRTVARSRWVVSRVGTGLFITANLAAIFVLVYALIY